MRRSLRRWLLHRRAIQPRPEPVISHGLAAYLSTNWRRRVVFADDLSDIPWLVTADDDPNIDLRATLVLPCVDPNAETVAGDPHKTIELPSLALK